MLSTPFSAWPSYNPEEIDAVSQVLRSNKVNYWTGQQCRNFESEFAQWADSAHAVALANGTLALEMAWRILGIREGDEVICTPRSFQASASSIAMAGAKPVFADVDLNSQNITPETVAPLISDRTKAILCVHLAGWPCDMEEFRQLASHHNIALVEDCAQAHGARIGGRSVGSFGLISAWSFCQDKIMTTGGEGGMVTMNEEALWRAAWSYKDHGKSWEAVYERQHSPGFRWLHDSFGTNWRLTEMQAAIGRVQLHQMPNWHAARTANAQRLSVGFGSTPLLRTPLPPESMTHAWYKFYAFVDRERLAAGWDRDRIMQEIIAAGVPCYSGSNSEIYREKSFVEANLAPKDRLPNARHLGETSLMFLVHPTLSEPEIGKTIAVVNDVCKRAQR